MDIETTILVKNGAGRNKVSPCHDHSKPEAANHSSGRDEATGSIGMLKVAGKA